MIPYLLFFYFFLISDWSVNPYPLCGPAGNCCAATMFKNGEVDKCERECLSISSPFQSDFPDNSTEEGNIKITQCFMNQRLRKAYEKRSALSKIINELGEVVFLPCSACGECAKESPRCGGCAMVLFCSRECQKTAWSEHKHICKSFKKFKQEELTRGGVAAVASNKKTPKKKKKKRK